MFPGLPTFGKHGYNRKQCFPVCPPLGNMTRKQCFLVCPLLRNMVCPPLGNMTRKQLPAKPFSSLPQVLVYIGVPSWTYTRGFGWPKYIFSSMDNEVVSNAYILFRI
jgi:hypothetical protein